MPDVTMTKLATEPKGERSAEPRSRRGADPTETLRKLRKAAFETVRNEGFRGATARNIANLAGCNQAAIYYHFGGIEALLIAALHESSEARLEHYRTVLDGRTTVDDILSGLADLHEADVESGHLDVLTELLGGITAEPKLVPGLRAAVMPWMEFVTSCVERVAKTLSLPDLVPASAIADAVFSVVIGTQIQAKFDNDSGRFVRNVNLARLAFALAGANLGPSLSGSRPRE
jgi:AcrR family transcriptional regulator